METIVCLIQWRGRGVFVTSGIPDDLKIKKSFSSKLKLFLWEHTGSNRGPSACKADALNQLSYAPFFVGSAKIGSGPYPPKKSFIFFEINLVALQVAGNAGCRTRIIPQYDSSSICTAVIWPGSRLPPLWFPYVT